MLTRQDRERAAQARQLDRIRDNLKAQGCTDPNAWRQLGDLYAGIGAQSNEARCRERERSYEAS